MSASAAERPWPAQAFHTLYHTDENALLGAPTGSGKTISAELAMLRVFRASPGAKVVYIAPLKVWLRPCMGLPLPCPQSKHACSDLVERAGRSW